MSEGTDGRNLVARSEAALELGRYDEAAQFARQAIAAEPDSHRGHVALGWAIQGSDPEQALESAQRAIALAPNSYVGYDLASAVATKKVEAIEYATRYRALLPNSAHANRRYAYVLFRHGGKRYRDEALACAHEAIRLDPNGAEGFNTLGMIQQYSFNKKKDARQSYERAIELDPLNSTTQQLLADSSEVSGDKAGALALVQQVVRLDPSNAGAREQLDNIAIGFLSDVLWATFAMSLLIAFIVDYVQGPG